MVLGLSLGQLFLDMVVEQEELHPAAQLDGSFQMWNILVPLFVRTFYIIVRVVVYVLPRGAYYSWNDFFCFLSCAGPTGVTWFRPGRIQL